MVNLSLFLRGLLPFITQPPAPIFSTPAFVVLSESSNAEEDANLAYLIQMAEQELRDRDGQKRPCPPIGGERITEDWLNSLTSRECLWQFR